MSEETFDFIGASEGIRILIGVRSHLLNLLEYRELRDLCLAPNPHETAQERIKLVAELETRLNVQVEPGPSLTIQADGDQLEQLLINLIRNAVDATLEVRKDGSVKVGWSKSGSSLEVTVQDDGPGISNPANLFVPFFTTKPEGSGIGLVFCRQIAEAHGGSLTLENRTSAPGCVARLRLPVG